MLKAGSNRKKSMRETKRMGEKNPPLKQDQLTALTGACGFIAGHPAIKQPA
jgi:hypothetical protein